MPLVEHWDLGENRILTQTTPNKKLNQRLDISTCRKVRPPPQHAACPLLQSWKRNLHHCWRMNYRTGCELHGSWFLDVLQGLVVSGNTKQRNHNHPLEKTMRGNHRRDSNHPKPSVIRSMVGMNPRLASLVSNQMVSRHVLIVRQVNGIFIGNQSRANSQDTHN